MDADLRLLFPTQSIGCRLFWRLSRALERRGGIGRCGFLVTNRLEFDRFAKTEGDFDRQAIDLIREWELLAAARAGSPPEPAAIDAWEREIGDPTLWNALILDRRLGFPLRAQFVQDYRPAYTHGDLLALLATALDAIAGQFDRVRPHAVVGLNAVTVYDYIYMLIARRRGIPYFQLKLTRIENYVSLYTNPFGISPHIAESFARLQAERTLNEAEHTALDQGRHIIARTRDQRLVYEGAVASDGGRTPSQEPVAAQSSLKRVAGLPAEIARVRAAWALDDPHYPPPLRFTWESRVLKPLRRRSQRRLFDVADVTAFRGRSCGTVCPVASQHRAGSGAPRVSVDHSEIRLRRHGFWQPPCPWGSPWSSRSIRTPAVIARRRFYRKLAAIPNVRLVPAEAPSGPLLDGAALVAVVYGTIGL